MLLFSSIAFSAEEIIRAVSWTLLHSLWQGVLLSLIAAFIMLFTKKASPSLRYNLLSAALVVFITGMAVTFITQLVHATETAQTSVIPASQINSAQPSANLIAGKTELSIINKAVGFLNVNAGWIVFTWLLIIGYKFIQLSSGLYNMHQLKKKQVSSPGEYWNKRITELCEQLQVNKKVQLLQSNIIRIPAVIGYFKPVILFPAAMLTAMSLQEVEAVLVHELGHIRRRDFLVNFLQNMVEIVFFFNPAVLWVSSLIKTERENCCDDIAVNYTANKQDYIKALITFQQFSQPANQQLAVAFSGEKNHLLTRVKRILYKNNKTLNNMEKKFLSAGIVLVSICFLTFVSLKAQVNKKPANPTIQQPASNISIEKTKPEVVSGARNIKPVNKSEVLQAKDKQEKPDADTTGKDVAQHNPKDENVYKFANKTGIHFGDDYLTAYYNGKEISKIDRKKSKEEIENWVKKYAPLTGVDLNALDESYYVKPAAHTQRIQPTSSTPHTPRVARTAPMAPIKPSNSSLGNTNSSTEGTTAPGFTGIYIDENLAIAYIKDKEISRITSKNSKAEIEKWRDDIEKLLNTKFPSIQQNLIDNKKE